MKAIEQEYSGIKFRSKTEAKWALFMDVIGCRWIYEPEGYDLGDGVFYCPDFYLPDADLFLEIKAIDGGIPSPTELFAIVTKKRIITMCGVPFVADCGEENGFAHFHDGEDFMYRFCLCPKCRLVGIEFMGRADRIKCKCEKSNHGDKGYNYDDPLILHAVELTKNAFRWNPKRNK